MDSSATIPGRRGDASAVLHADGSGILTIDGVDRPFAAPDPGRARTAVLSRVRAHAEDLGEPVRLRATDPDGRRSELVVHADGHVQRMDRAAARAPSGSTARAPALAVVAVLIVGVVLGLVVFSTVRLAAPGATAPSAAPSRQTLSAASRPSRPTGAESNADRAVERAAAARRRAAARHARRRAAAARARRARRARERVARRTALRAPQPAPTTPAPAVGNVGAAQAPTPPPAAAPRQRRMTPGDLPPAQP